MVAHTSFAISTAPASVGWMPSIEISSGRAKPEPSSKLGYVTRTSQFHKLLKEASETVIRMLERRAADPEAAKAILSRLKAAAVTIGDPVGSLKE